MKFIRTIALTLLALPLGAQTVQCPNLQPEALVRVPEIQAKDHKLRGTVLVSAEQECIGFRVPASAPQKGMTMQYQPQWVRTMRGVDTVPATPTTPANQYGQPLPGPTLRARVGDLVELTLLNEIDTGVFPYSIDQAEKNGAGCDQTSSYPQITPAFTDTYPDCFHGSSTGNMHFHGTHTNPNSTGDNVFLEIRPSPRTKDQANKPIIRGPLVKPMFDEFFKRCEAELPATNPMRQWPYTWSDLPHAFTVMQEKLLKEYDESHKQKLWPVDAKQIAKEQFPQYYIGAFPYCYRIPEYNSATWPPEPAAASHAAHTGGSGSSESTAPTHPLEMGQSPGTHWYHAHKHGSTAIDVANGMTGAFIIEGQYDDDLNTWYGTGWTQKQPVLVIQQIGVSPNLERGGGGKGQGPDKGPNFSVNGRYTPIITMAPSEVQLWRIVNTSGRAGVHFVGPPTGFHWRQLAQDGVQFNDANYQSPNFHDQPITMFAGNRIDILVQAPSSVSNGPVNVMVQNLVDPSDLTGSKPAYPMTLVSVNVTGSPATGNNAQFIPKAPTQPPFLADIMEKEVTGTKSLLFQSDFPGTNAPRAVTAHDQRRAVQRRSRRGGPPQHGRGVEGQQRDLRSAHLPSVPHPHQPVPGGGDLRSERHDPRHVDAALRVRQEGRDLRRTVRARRAPPGDVEAVLPDARWQQERLVGRLRHSVRHRRSRCTGEPDQGRAGQPDHGAGLLQDAQPFRRLQRLLRPALPHPRARGPRHDDGRRSRSAAVTVLASLIRTRGPAGNPGRVTLQGLMA